MSLVKSSEEHDTRLQATMHITPANLAALPLEPSQPLERLFLENKDLVFRAAYRITGNASDAEDVLQTVFLRLARQRDSVKIASVSAYLRRSAVNAALDLLRAKSAHSLSLDEPNQAEPALESHSEAALEIRDWLRQALGRLNPRSAEMFVLRFIEDYSNHEIARMMNTSVAVVAVVLHRTRAQLKKDFQGMTRDVR